MQNVRIDAAVEATQFATAREFFVEYSKALGIDLCFQGFTEELERLPALYAPPAGRLLLARLGDDVVGCVAVRARGVAECEMKRLYVRSEHRGLQIGRSLAHALIEHARADGHRRMVLHTLESMTAARGLYRALGFTPCPPYDPAPVAGSVYLALDLTAPGGTASSSAT
jgi:putative acetyltransferase